MTELFLKMIKITRAFKPKGAEDSIVWVERLNPELEPIYLSRRNIWESSEGYEIWFSGVANSWYIDNNNQEKPSLELIVKSTIPLSELVGKEFKPKTLPDSSDLLLVKV